MSSDALMQFLARVAELKRRLRSHEVGQLANNRPAGHNRTEIANEAIRRDIAAYERAITALIPRTQNA